MWGECTPCPVRGTPEGAAAPPACIAYAGKGGPARVAQMAVGCVVRLVEGRRTMPLVESI